MNLTMNAPAVEAAPTAPVPEVDLNAPLVITKTMALELLERAVAEMGADHQAECFYVFPDLNGTLMPNCMVGYALSYVGVPLAELREWNSTRIYELPATQLSGVNITSSAMDVFGTAQDQQDVGSVWGEALASARQA